MGCWLVASTITLANTITWAQTFLGYRPLAVSSNEPALTSANLVLQTILGPPFGWRWNRNTKSGLVYSNAAVAPANQDQTASVSDFGFIEKAYISLPAGSPPPAFVEMKVKPILSLATEQARPDAIAAQADDNAGNITFRVSPAPDQIYGATVYYQKKAVLMTGTGSTWSPIPDEYAYVYNAGFLALMMFYSDDPRAAFFNQKFVGSLLGLAEGLTETQRELFLSSWLSYTASEQRNSLRTQQGVAGRGA